MVEGMVCELASKTVVKKGKTAAAEMAAWMGFRMVEWKVAETVASMVDLTAVQTVARMVASMAKQMVGMKVAGLDHGKGVWMVSQKAATKDVLKDGLTAAWTAASMASS